MNRQQAQRILICHRPGIDNESGPEIKEALRLAEMDPELMTWLETQSASNDVIRAHLRAIPVPPDLGCRILAGRKIVAPWWRRREFLATAAAFALLLTLSALWFWHSDEEETFAAFRSRMVRFARREYRMDIVTNNTAQVRQFLAKRGAPVDFTLTRGLESRPVIGGAKLSWQGHPVSMVCFTGPKNEMLFLFVLDRVALRHGHLPASAPAVVPMRRLNTADWSRGDKVYLLAAPIADAELRKLL